MGISRNNRIKLEILKHFEDIFQQNSEKYWYFSCPGRQSCRKKKILLAFLRFHRNLHMWNVSFSWFFAIFQKLYRKYFSQTSWMFSSRIRSCVFPTFLSSWTLDIEIFPFEIIRPEIMPINRSNNILHILKFSTGTDTFFSSPYFTKDLQISISFFLYILLYNRESIRFGWNF